MRLIKFKNPILLDLQLMRQTAKIILAWELYEQNVEKAHIAERLLVNRDTIPEWIRKIEAHP